MTNFNNKEANQHMDELEAKVAKQEHTEYWNNLAKKRGREIEPWERMGISKATYERLRKLS